MTWHGDDTAVAVARHVARRIRARELMEEQERIAEEIRIVRRRLDIHLVRRIRERELLEERESMAEVRRIVARRIRNCRVATPLLNKYRKDKVVRERAEAAAARAAGAIADAAARAERAAERAVARERMDALIAASQHRALPQDALTEAELEALIE